MSGEIEERVQFGKSQYNETSCLQSTQLPEVVNIISKIDIDNSIKSEAINIYYKMMNERHDCKISSVKGLQKTSLIFFCIYMGFMQTGNLIDPYFAASIVKLNPKSVNRALNSYTFPGCVIYQPEDSIDFYIFYLHHHFRSVGQSFNTKVFHEEMIKIIKVCRSTEAGRQWILQNSIRIVCITVVYFFLTDILRIPVDKFEKVYTITCYATKANIKRYYLQLCTIYNTVESDIEERPKQEIDLLTMFD
ncbi:MAG: hypothetical protein Solivirus1_59 [Solivirus sp.]|uniref:Uncharacterized protein n=1 Tax=Solivirus sp. TaxID=2487772 RepID=A0A3G5AFF0_9VIRU|nr:MAG: hypothetical protein Solivirus1_59 [Solivirus sp.]